MIMICICTDVNELSIEKVFIGKKKCKIKPVVCIISISLNGLLVLNKYIQHHETSVN